MKTTKKNNKKKTTTDKLPAFKKQIVESRIRDLIFSNAAEKEIAKFEKEALKWIEENEKANALDTQKAIFKMYKELQNKYQ